MHSCCACGRALESPSQFDRALCSECIDEGGSE